MFTHQIKKIIAVASGKGGVGKSTVAINLALALQQGGAKVGLLDADIYGPSQPNMLGAAGEQPSISEGKLKPIEALGLKSMSIGFLIEQIAPVVWRGPMLGKALEQMLKDTIWGELDYLVIDLPPGTGDVQISLCQKIPVNGAVIVTTPQDVALLDVRRACEMFKKLNVTLLGVIENMSLYHCPHCGHEDRLFGEGGGLKLAGEYNIKLLGSLPLNSSIREMTDGGHPPVVQEPNGVFAKTFAEIARQIADILRQQPKDYSKLFPKIVVEEKNQKE